MKLNQVLGDGEAESESHVFSRIGTVVLKEAVKDMRQKCGIDPNSRVVKADLDSTVDSCSMDSNSAFSRRELHGIGQEIPEDLLHALSVRSHNADVRGNSADQLHSLDLRRRLNGFQ